MTVACAWIPDLPATAALRVEPELRGHPLAIVDGGVIVSGFLRGLTLAQARTIEPDLVVRELARAGIASTHEALIDVALSISPRVEDAGPGCVHVDLAGTGMSFPTPRGLLTAFETRLGGVGLERVRLGLGPTRTVAHLAARAGEGGHIVSPDGIAGFLDPLPIELLDAGPEIEQRLFRWGLRTLGEVARLPRGPLGARLGEAGVALARRAAGEDLEPFRTTPPRPRFEEGVAPDHPIENLEALAFVLRGTLERLSRRLRTRGLAVHELWIECALTSRRRFARRVALGAPTTEVPVLLSLVRLALERDAPPESVEQLRVVATPGAIETAQLDLFRPPRPAPAELSVTVARLESMCGSDRVGTPGLEDSHRPDAARLEPLRSGTGPAAPTGPDPIHPAMALRALRPPRALRVDDRDGTPRGVRGAIATEQRLIVRACAGPWRLFGEWWGERRFARDYFDVELSDGGLYRIYHNLEGGGWYLDGIYD